MPEWVFRYFLQGKSVEDIIDSSRDPKPTSEEVRRMINEEREKFEEACLKSILINARKGDVSAIDWLFKRGLFESIRGDQ